MSPLPGNPTPPMTPGGVCGPSPFYQSPLDQKPCVDAVPPPSPMMDPSQRGVMLDHTQRVLDSSQRSVEEPRLTFLVREAPIMLPFKLEHNLSVSKFMFALSHHDYSQVMSRFIHV